MVPEIITGNSGIRPRYPNYPNNPKNNPAQLISSQPSPPNAIISFPLTLAPTPSPRARPNGPTAARRLPRPRRSPRRRVAVAKMASHAIFQYNVLAIDDTHNTWTNMIVKMTIIRLLGSSNDKEKICAARTEGPTLQCS